MQNDMNEIKLIDSDDIALSLRESLGSADFGQRHKFTFGNKEVVGNPSSPIQTSHEFNVNVLVNSKPILWVKVSKYNS